MIIELLSIPFITVVEFMINLIPEGFVLPSYLSYTLDILKYPLSIFPVDLWILIISNVSFWYMVQISWAIVEWIYKKLPSIS